MDRRSFVAGVTLALVALAGCLDDDGDGDSEGDDDSDTSEDDTLEVTTVDAPGSDAGTVTIPDDGQVQLVNCVRTTCPTSRGMLPRVGEARDRLAETYDVGLDGDVHVLTVIDESSGGSQSADELADWWAEQDGDWTVGVDDEGAVFDRYDVDGTPTTFAVDGAGEVHWRDEQGTTPNNLISGVETALEASDG
ncbi:TlpA family protein disulfide reductase [Natronolimnohabitans innermongolicus]|nr:TlpA disulfide reductase family protein [Natronolimnohabitans innermongolicus]